PCRPTPPPAPTHAGSTGPPHLAPRCHRCPSRHLAEEADSAFDTTDSLLLPGSPIGKEPDRRPCSAPVRLRGPRLLAVILILLEPHQTVVGAEPSKTHHHAHPLHRMTSIIYGVNNLRPLLTPEGPRRTAQWTWSER